MNNLDFGFKDGDLEIIESAIQMFPDIEKAAIFGSRAKGNYRRGSDVDIAIYGNIDNHTHLRLSAYLNDETPLPYFFDVIDYEALKNEKLKESIDAFGKVIFLNY